MTSLQTLEAGPALPTGRLWRSSRQFVEEDRQEIQWLVPGVLPAGAIVLLSGREGTMKSFLALSMAHAVASGALWLGRPTKQGRVLYLDGEMPKAVMQDRVQGIGVSHALGLCCWTDPEFPYQLNNLDLQGESEECSLIVVDTLRRHMDGLKENSSDDMAQITKDLRRLTGHGATVLVLHHAPKDISKQDYRGATELGAGADVVLLLTRRNLRGTAVLTIETRKTRYSSGGRLEIEAKEGPHVPVFTIRGDQKPAKDDLSELSLLVNELRGRFGRNPIQDEIIQAAKTLGGKDKIRQMLKEGEDRYWIKERSRKTVSYASTT